MLPLFEEAAETAGLAGLTVLRSETQGPLLPTGRPLDLAIDGVGYFAVYRDGTQALTRRGTLHLTPAGQLALKVAGREWLLSGSAMLPTEAAPPRIDSAGSVFRSESDLHSELVGRIELVRPESLSALDAVAGGLLIVPNSSHRLRVGHPSEAGWGTIQQGTLEGSNGTLKEDLRQLGDLRRQIAALNLKEPERRQRNPR